MTVKDIIKQEIDKLPEELAQEIYDFIQFLETKRERTRLIKAAQNLSEESFAKIWDNEEDAVYDRL